ncbi:hypothetical protein OT109_06580 [Phycisphaeraceae bacterium D3-23]
MAQQQETSKPAGPPATDVSGLVSAVESKMTELMAWHERQASAFASEKKQYEEELWRERASLASAQREAREAQASYAARQEAADRQREQLKQAASALQSRLSTLDEELAAARSAREQAELAATELEQQRSRAADQTQRLMDAVAGLDRPRR